MAYKESWSGKINRKLIKKQHIIDVAAGREKADLVLKNATYVNVFSGELDKCDIAVAEGLIVGLGSYEGYEEADMTGKIVCPGFVDAHIHLESSLVSPAEFARAVIPHGTTTVITDPHEITNVMGTDGIDYMLCATQDLPVDVRFMIPSCVPASPLDESGANLDYRDVDSFFDHPRVQGLAEMMNFPGIISGDGSTVSKIVASQAHHKKIDGHAPGIEGKDLAAYIAAGKVAINHPRGKNLLGAFYQPELVIIDPDTLKTLDERQIGAGLGEVIKYGCIYDAALFDRLERLGSREALMPVLDEIIARCCEIKAEYVRQDPHDHGVRMQLNFGHTLAHALENAAGYGTLLHGEAVSIGMAAACGWGEALGVTPKDTQQRVTALLERYGLMTHRPENLIVWADTVSAVLDEYYGKE